MVGWPPGVSKKVLRDTAWDLPSGVIADKTRSGKDKARAGHASAPKSFRVVLRMSLDEYRVFEDWYINTTRKGALSFAFPKINDDSGEAAEYRFAPGSKIAVSSPGGLAVTVSMEWAEA
jgi:hypothetical protein